MGFEASYLGQTVAIDASTNGNKLFANKQALSCDGSSGEDQCVTIGWKTDITADGQTVTATYRMGACGIPTQCAVQEAVVNALTVSSDFTCTSCTTDNCNTANADVAPASTAAPSMMMAVVAALAYAMFN